MLDTQRQYTTFFPLSILLYPSGVLPPSLLNYTVNRHGVYPPTDNTGVTPQNENDLGMQKFI